MVLADPDLGDWHDWIDRLDRFPDRRLDPNVVTAATKDLRACFNMAGASELAGLILEALGLARYTNEGEIRDTENFLAQQSHGTAVKILGAVTGLEALLRQHPQHQIGEDARMRLRHLVMYGARSSQPPALDADARIRRQGLDRNGTRKWHSRPFVIRAREFSKDFAENA